MASSDAVSNPVVHAYKVGWVDGATTTLELLLGKDGDAPKYTGPPLPEEAIDWLERALQNVTMLAREDELV